jgi:myosin heavy subunit
MNTYAGDVPVPNTSALAASSAAAATITVTQTVTETVPAAVHASFYAAVKHSSGSASSLASAVPAHLMDQTAILFKHAQKGTFTKLPLLLGALKCGLGVMVVFGIGAALKRFPTESVPPGEDPRTWEQKATFAYNCLKNAAKDNEQLRKGIAVARQEMDLEREARREDAKVQKMTLDELRLELKKEKEAHKEQKDMYETIDQAVDMDRKALTERKDRVLALEMQLEDVNDKLDARLEENADLRTDMLLAKAEINGLESRVGWLKSEKASLETQVKQLQQLLAAKNLELENEQDTNAIKHHEHKKTQDEVATLQAKLQQSQRETGSLQQQVNDAKSEADRAEALQSELDRVTEELDNERKAHTDCKELLELSEQVEVELRAQVDADQADHASKVVAEQVARRKVEKQLDREIEKCKQMELERRAQPDSSRNPKSPRQTGIQATPLMSKAKNTASIIKKEDSTSSSDSPSGFTSAFQALIDESRKGDDDLQFTPASPSSGVVASSPSDPRSNSTPSRKRKRVSKPDAAENSKRHSPRAEEGISRDESMNALILDMSIAPVLARPKASSQTSRESSRRTAPTTAATPATARRLSLIPTMVQASPSRLRRNVSRPDSYNEAALRQRSASPAKRDEESYQGGVEASPSKTVGRATSSAQKEKVIKSPRKAAKSPTRK